MDTVRKMNTMTFIVLLAATITAGLMAGLFYAFSVSVMPGLGRGDDKTFVEGMRGINVAIINGWFLLSFLGAPLLAGVAVILNLGSGATLWWTVAGFACLVGMIVLTGAVHIPMNNALMEGGDAYGKVREMFETRWVRWNILRTLVTIGGFASLVGALVSR
jgi:uncharacterized membrane protein